MRHIDYYNQFVIAKGGDSSGITPTGTLEIKIQENGTTTHDVTHYAQAEVTVDVPQPDGTIQITQNGQHDVAQYATADVNVPNPSTGTLELDYGELEFGQTVDETQDVTDKAEVHIAVSAKEPSGTLDITENGTKDVAGYASVNVQVPQPTGTKEINITQNGESTEDVAQYENAHIVVNVPNEDTGTKEIRITENGNSQHDVTGFATADITVAVPEPTGTAELAYTLEAGNYSLDETADVSDKAEAHVTVDASALEPTGTKEVTVNQNGDITEDVKDYASVKITTQVDSGGGEDTATLLITDQLESYSNNELTELGEYAICGKSRLKTLSLPNCTKIGDHGLYGCYGLETIELPSVTECGNYALANMTGNNNIGTDNDKLKEISLPMLDDLSDINTLNRGHYLFYGRTQLQKVTLPKLRKLVVPFRNSSKNAIHTIDMLGGGGRPFTITNSLLEHKLDIVFRGTLDEVKSPSKYGDNYNTMSLPEDYAIYVDDSMLDAYKTATGWSKIADHIFPLSEYVPQEVV